MNLDDYNRIKEAAESVKTKRERAVGAYNEAAKQLREKWDCASIAEAREKLKQMRTQHAELGKKLEQHIKDFKTAWVHLLKTNEQQDE